MEEAKKQQQQQQHCCMIEVCNRAAGFSTALLANSLDTETVVWKKATTI